ncbi:30S ribosomal protein S13 [Candidatus Pacearchaeota archaeon]|nr:30S ribosomal protein S13 [Candidatus Pacearchaeota archaeon]
MEQKIKQHPKNQAAKEENMEKIVRIMSTDIEGGMKVYPGLTKIKGVSWSYSNAICKILNFNKSKKISELSEEEIKKISESIKNPKVPEFLFNRKRDYETGLSRHLTTTDLEFRKDFDIKRMKKIKSYKGLRHSLGQPVRGQRTKAHFRTKKTKGVGIKKKVKTEETTKLSGAQLK